MRRNPWALGGCVLVAALVVVAMLAPALPLHNPDRTRPAARLQPPSRATALGTDHLGRDLLSRVIWGARVSIAVGLGATTIALVIGSTMGLLAGFYAGVVDAVAMRTVDILLAFPYILLAIALVAVLGPGLFNAMLAVAAVNVTFYARGVRSAVLLVRESEYVEASRVLGATGRWILRRHVLPNIIAPMVVFASLNVGWMITETAGLSFIGLGAQPPTADWGSMLADGRAFITVAPHIALIPGMAIFLLVLGLNLIGDGLREALDPRLR
jgi:peptide/nickel transport system permease protein